MILTAPAPSPNSAAAIPSSVLEEIAQLMSEHKAVRLVPEDEAVTIEEAAKLLGAKTELIGEMLTVRTLRSVNRNGERLVRLDSLLEFKKSCTEHPPWDEFNAICAELEAKGLY